MHGTGRKRTTVVVVVLVLLVVLVVAAWWWFVYRKRQASNGGRSLSTSLCNAPPLPGRTVPAFQHVELVFPEGSNRIARNACWFCHTKKKKAGVPDPAAPCTIASTPR